jgi:vacuolar-type H+-ATPase subunit E/Vma4
MGKTAKTDNFLNSIKKYAERQRVRMCMEVEQLKEAKIKEAESKAKADSEKLVRTRLESKRNEMTSKLAKLTQEGQKKLFLERAEMTESIFKKAEDKLIAFTQSDKYEEHILKSAKNIADFFNNQDCVLYLNEKDMIFADKIKALFSENTEISKDNSVKIGGIKGYSNAKGIIADETLDSKLEAQKEWFYTNCTLSVI